MHKSKLFFLAVFLIIFLFGIVKNSEAAEYYVNLNAASNGNGSLGDPWNDLNSARASQGPVVAGDTVYIWGTKTSLGISFTSSDSGSYGLPITYMERSGYEAIFDGTGSANNFITFSNGTSYLIFDGLEIRNYPNAGFSFTGASVTNANNITIQNCYLHDMAGYGSIHSGSGDVHNLNILNNTIFSNGTDYSHHGIYLAEGTDIVIRGNDIGYSSGNGIEINTRSASGRIIDGLTIDRNNIHENGTDTGNGAIIMDNDGGENSLSDVTVSNNLIWGNSESGIAYYQSDNTFNSILNNTVYNNRQWGIEFYATPEPIVRNNICYLNSSGFINDTNRGIQSNNISTNPNFLSTTSSSSDFLKLSALSTNCIDQGYDVSSIVTNDYWGNDRSDGNIDIGASEYFSESNSLSPSSPSGLTVR